MHAPLWAEPVGRHLYWACGHGPYRWGDTTYKPWCPTNMPCHTCTHTHAHTSYAFAHIPTLHYPAAPMPREEGEGEEEEEMSVENMEGEEKGNILEKKKKKESMLQDIRQPCLPHTTLLCLSTLSLYLSLAIYGLLPAGSFL